MEAFCDVDSLETNHPSQDEAPIFQTSRRQDAMVGLQWGADVKKCTVRLQTTNLWDCWMQLFWDADLIFVIPSDLPNKLFGSIRQPQAERREVEDRVCSKSCCATISLQHSDVSGDFQAEFLWLGQPGSGYLAILRCGQVITCFATIDRAALIMVRRR